MLWSIGKDSTTLLWLARKAFFGRVPFPLVHIDTNLKHPEMIAYRDRMAREWGVDLVVGKNEQALCEGMERVEVLQARAEEVGQMPKHRSYNFV